MAKGAAAGSAFLTGVLGTLSAEDRAKGEAALQTLQALGGGAVVAAIGDGTLAQTEFSRLTNDLTEQRTALETLEQQLADRDAALTKYHGELTEWYAGNKELLDAGKKAKVTPNPTPTPIPPAGLTAEQLDERIRIEQAGFLGFQRDQNQLEREHFGRFNEFLDLDALLKHPEIRNVGLKGVYDLVYKDRLTEHATATQKAHDDKLRAEGAAAERERNAQMPYVTPTGAGSGSPLDALTGERAPDGLVDQAAAHYARLQAERNGARA